MIFGVLFCFLTEQVNSLTSAVFKINSETHLLLVFHYEKELSQQVRPLTRACGVLHFPALLLSSVCSDRVFVLFSCPVSEPFL